MNILSIDLEEWYTYQLYPKGGPVYYLPILQKYLDRILDGMDAQQLTGTFFCLGVIAREFPTVIKQIADRGHEIACHSDKHHWITKMTRDSFSQDTRIAIDSLEQVCGKKVLSYRAPAFSITPKNTWAFEVLHECGIEFDSSVFPASRSFGGFPLQNAHAPMIIEHNGIRLKELPIPLCTVAGKQIAYSGGGYFRLLPYSFIQKQMQASNYNMTYFHLRDFDSEQKQVISLRYFQSYFGVKWALPKFERMMKEFKFISVENAAAQINWNQVKTVQL